MNGSNWKPQKWNLGSSLCVSEAILFHDKRHFVINNMTVSRPNDYPGIKSFMGGSVPGVCLRLGPPWLN